MGPSHDRVYPVVIHVQIVLDWGLPHTDPLRDRDYAVVIHERINLH